MRRTLSTNAASLESLYFRVMLSWMLWPISTSEGVEIMMNSSRPVAGLYIVVQPCRKRLKTTDQKLQTKNFWNPAIRGSGTRRSGYPGIRVTGCPVTLSFKFNSLLPPGTAVPFADLPPQLPGGFCLQVIRRGLEKLRGLKIAVVIIFFGLEQALEDIGD